MKWKAHIPIPHSSSKIGVADPFGVLEPGEIFVQYQDNSYEEDQGRKLITGDVIVTRFPLSHPSCIRKLKAVAAPELSYLVDVIVFSTKGDRPAQHMMSGGDLDGDKYFVSWDKNLVSQVTEVDPPGEVPSRDEYLSEPIAKNSIASNITYYLKNDCLG